MLEVQILSCSFFFLRLVPRDNPFAHQQVLEEGRDQRRGKLSRQATKRRRDTHFPFVTPAILNVPVMHFAIHVWGVTLTVRVCLELRMSLFPSWAVRKKGTGVSMDSQRVERIETKRRTEVKIIADEVPSRRRNRGVVGSDVSSISVRLQAEVGAAGGGGAGSTFLGDGTLTRGREGREGVSCPAVDLGVAGGDDSPRDSEHLLPGPVDAQTGRGGVFRKAVAQQSSGSWICTT